VRQQLNVLQQAADLRDRTCRDTRQTTAIAFNDTRKLVEQLALLDRNTLSIEKARDAYRQQFDIGQRSLLDLLNAENEVYTAKRAYANAEYDLGVAYARTQAAMNQLTTQLGVARVDPSVVDATGWTADDDAPGRCPVVVSEVTATDRATLLMSMGLFDEAIDKPPEHWSLLTTSLAYNRGGASRQSIYAIERFVRSVPSDYADRLLPHVVRQLLYPRYFWNEIESDSKQFNADPTLVVAIMREESRFNPRAKSEAAARGLLQFIITTARQIGRDAGLVDVEPDDLYDPRIVIRLGAKYVGELLAKLSGDRYATAAAYNAGPNQAKLWQRMQPAGGDDYFVSAINFDETKNYVRNVMNSDAQYREIY